MMNTTWKKSTRCGTTSCVEVAIGDDSAHVRDTKPGDDTVLRFAGSDWMRFIDGLKRSDGGRA